MTMIALEYKEIMQAITALTSCRKILAEVAERIRGGNYASVTIGEWLATAWYKINVCRLFTQDSVDFEGYLQSAMGLIVDAKEMVESLAAWNKGVTRAGQANILICTQDATDLAYTAQVLLENMLCFQTSP